MFFGPEKNVQCSHNKSSLIFKPYQTLASLFNKFVIYIDSFKREQLAKYCASCSHLEREHETKVNSRLPSYSSGFIRSGLLKIDPRLILRGRSLLSILAYEVQEEYLKNYIQVYLSKLKRIHMSLRRRT